MASIPADRVAIYLSGGFDSWSLVFAARAAGKQVTGYVFHMEGRTSTDLKLARANSKMFDVALEEFRLPAPKSDALIADVGFLKRELGCVKKAEIECVWPFKKSLPCVVEAHVVLGHGADDLYGTTKKAAIHFKNDLDAFRRDELARSQNQIDALVKLFQRHDKTVLMPYETPVVQQVFAGANWDDLHKPKMKQPTRDAFPEFELIKVVRQGLQVGDSGIRDAFETLLASPYNVTKALDVTAIYNRV